jgi:glutamine synthetase
MNTHLPSDSQCIDDNERACLVCVTDYDGMLRGKRLAPSKIAKIAKSTIGFSDVLFWWNIQDDLIPHRASETIDRTYSDGKVLLDWSTRRTNWLDSSVDVVIGEFTGDHSGMCSRGLLRSQVNRLRELGIEARVGFELEFGVFSLDNNKDVKWDCAKKGNTGYSVSELAKKEDWSSRLLTMAHEMSFPIEGFHTETGPGMYEVALEATEPLESADRAALFKTFLRALCKAHGTSITFMAKPDDRMPTLGGHIHISFAGDNAESLLCSALASLLLNARDLTLMFAPNVNSYKRYTPGHWTPVRIDWGYEDRNRAFRWIGSGLESRIETRIAGADTNPYLATAAILGCAIDGISRALRLEKIPDSLSTNPAEMPSSLGEAISLLRGSTFANKVFDQQFLQQYLYTRESEWRKYLNAVTDWEKARYLSAV